MSHGGSRTASACTCSHVSQQGSKACSARRKAKHYNTTELTLASSRCDEQRITQSSEPEKQSGEENNSTSDKVVVKPDNLKSTVWRLLAFWSVGGKVDRLFASYAVQSSRIILLVYLKSEAATPANGTETFREGLLSKQAKLTACYSFTALLPAAKQEPLTKKVTLTAFLCKDMHPISIVDGIGFNNVNINIRIYSIFGHTLADQNSKLISEAF